MSAEACGDCWKHSPLSGDQLVIHLAIADVVNDVHDNRLWMTRATLAIKARTSRATVDRTLRALTEGGWLTVVHAGGGRGNPTEYLYQLTGKPRQDETLYEETASPGEETASFDPIHPLLIPRTQRESRATKPPKDWDLTDERLTWVQSEHPGLDPWQATKEWLTWAHSVGRPYKDWEMAWKNAMHRAARWHVQSGPTRTFLGGHVQ